MPIFSLFWSGVVNNPFHLTPACKGVETSHRVSVPSAPHGVVRLQITPLGDGCPYAPMEIWGHSGTKTCPTLMVDSHRKERLQLSRNLISCVFRNKLWKLVWKERRVSMFFSNSYVTDIRTAKYIENVSCITSFCKTSACAKDGVSRGKYLKCLHTCVDRNVVHHSAYPFRGCLIESAFTDLHRWFGR